MPDLTSETCQCHRQRSSGDKDAKKRGVIMYSMPVRCLKVLVVNIDITWGAEGIQASTDISKRLEVFASKSSLFG